MRLICQQIQISAIILPKAVYAPRRMHCGFLGLSCRLKCHFSTDLSCSWELGACRCPKGVSTVPTIVHTSQVHAIENIKHIETKFQIHSVGNFRYFVERHVGLGEPWIAELVDRLISFLSHLWE